MGNRSSNSRRYFLSGASAIAIATAVPSTSVQAQDNDESRIEEVIVTARKRTENLQDIPASIQALTGGFLRDMGAQSMADYGRFLASVTVQTYSGAAGSQVFFRGITTAGNDFIASASASIYLNESSITMVGASPNLRMIDVSRVEALAGPQGTLYGAAAQSGTLRVYTNQPNTREFEANIDLTFKTGADSDLSHDIIAVLNIPLVRDKFAVRIAVNSGEDGGYIDNVFGHSPDSISGGPGSLPAEAGTLTNSHVVQDNFNNTDFFTAVISARWELNQNWAATASYRYSENISHGTDFFNPFVGDLDVVQFNPSLREEKWDVGSLVIEGDMGWAQIVSSTSFYNRDYFYNLDSTAYMRYYSNWACSPRADQSYYYWTFPDPNNPGAGIYYAKYCMGAAVGDDWTGIVAGPENQDRFSQEIRLLHQGEDFDWLLGAYYEDANDDWDNIWMVPGHGGQLYPDSMAATFWRTKGFVAANSWQNIPACPECIPLVDEGIGGLFSRDRTNFKQKAIFGEFTWHATDRLDLTVGGRYFERTTTKSYLQWHVTTGTFRDPSGILLKFGFRDGQSGQELNIGKDKEFIPKVTVKYELDDDKMIYATYTQGYRPGGANRGRNDWANPDGTCTDSSRRATDPNGVDLGPSCTLFPQAYDPDRVTNYEVGSRMQFGNNFRLNATFFYMKWNDYQLELLEPSIGRCGEGDALPAPNCDQPWTKVVGNIGEAHTMGIELDALWVPSESLDVGGNLAWIEAEIDEDFSAAGASRGPVSFGAIEKGQRLPSVPKLKGSMWANYHWDTSFGEMSLRGQLSYVGSSFSDLVPTTGDVALPNLRQDSYAIGDISLSIDLDDIVLRFFVNNVTDTRAQISHKPDKFGWLIGHSTEYQRMDRMYTNRPREFGIRLSYAFGAGD